MIQYYFTSASSPKEITPKTKTDLQTTQTYNRKTKKFPQKIAEMVFSTPNQRISSANNKPNSKQQQQQQ